MTVEDLPPDEEPDDDEFVFGDKDPEDAVDDEADG